MPINNKLSLKRETITTLLEAKVLVEEYMSHCNQEKPHSAPIATSIGNRLRSISRRFLV